jgi:hypothetical protein
MNYYLDTEFLEGIQSKSFLGIQYGKTKPTIDLISIGIVSGDCREYYAISNEFNLKEGYNGTLVSCFIESRGNNECVRDMRFMRYKEFSRK